MKNKFDILFLAKILIFSLILSNNLYSEEIQFKSSKVFSLDNGNIIRAEDGVNIFGIKNITLSSDKAEYIKDKSLIKVLGNAQVYDEINNIKINSQEIIYYKKLNKIESPGATIIIINDEYEINGFNIIFDRNLNNIYTENESILQDTLENIIRSENLDIDLNEKILSAKEVNIKDAQLNYYNIENLKINLKNNKVVGKDLDIRFNNTMFANPENEPRLKGNAIFFNKKSSIINKGVFTTCKSRDGCPPWQMSASKIKHDKLKKSIIYDNAWLKLYDIPVFYFPKFFHPDPTVKRQSGFLMPKFAQSSSLGNHVITPYFHVFSESSDLTFTPRIYSNEKALYQTELRKISKNSEHVFDFSILTSKLYSVSDSQSHLFSESFYDLNLDNFDSSEISLQIQQTSNDYYLKTYLPKSPLIKTQSSLHNKFKFEAINDDTEIEITTEVYEDLSVKKDSDKYEYILPNYKYSKDIVKNDYGDFVFSSNGYNKKYDTNINESIIVNNLKFSSASKFTNLGLVHNYEFLLKNFNATASNSRNYTKKENEIKSIFNYQIKYPLSKKGKKYNSTWSPIISARYSPNKSRNIRDNDRILDYNNIFSLNRIASSETVEGGQSITIGNEYILNKLKSKILTMDLGLVFSDTKNDRLPQKTTLNKKTSDLVGSSTFEPNKYLEFSYDFSLASDLDTINYNKIGTRFKVNNFVSTFEFLEKNNIIGDDSYLTNKTSLNLNDKSSLVFSTRENKAKDLTEYYNFIYQYKMDCLTAGIEYKKDYYSDGTLKANENILLSITIMPFTSINTPLK
tara:strand:- start:1058 stop:3448 length:2391 start_codon:yes stop_codon:yes gene_type:complete